MTSLENLKIYMKKYFFIYALSLLFLRPKKFMYEIIYNLIDYFIFFKSLGTLPLSIYSEAKQIISSNNKGGLLIVFGSNMGIMWVQLWSFLGLLYKGSGKSVYCLTSKTSKMQNLYISKCKFNFIYIEDIKFEQEIVNKVFINKLKSFSDFKNFAINDIPFGKMALSTYSRKKANGSINITDKEVKNEILNILEFLLKAYKSSLNLYSKYDIKMAFFTEVFMEYYGPLYYAGLKRKINVIRFNGTIRDEAVVLQHMTAESDRTHFSSLSSKSMKWLKALDFNSSLQDTLEKNFKDRYGDRWNLSTRNQINTKIVEADKIKSYYNLSKKKKIGIIYSHILYDTLFFNGEYLFDNYAIWLIETIKMACLNPDVNWFIKVHPSNIWRGDLEYYHKGKYEELRLIEDNIGNLPDHVKIIFPDTPFSPYSWLKVADLGVTVTGTSGIELGALGKIVITGGTGRYDQIGFTINSKTTLEYKNRILSAHKIPKPTYDQTLIAKKFAYATFCSKPFNLDFFKPKPRTGKKIIFGIDDLTFVYKSNNPNTLSSSTKKFLIWSLDRSNIDLLTI